MQNILTAILAFISTNIDDIFILMLFYASSRFVESRIMIGQFLGITTLVLISLIASYIGGFFDERYVGLLGFFPVYLAIRQIIDLVKNKDSEDEPDVTSTGILSVAGVTIANGADNIGVYVPLFSTMNTMEKIEMLVVFAVMTYTWCKAAKYLSSRPLIARQLAKYGHIITPIVLLLLGVFILAESNTISLLTSPGMSR